MSMRNPWLLNPPSREAPGLMNMSESVFGETLNRVFGQSTSRYGTEFTAALRSVKSPSQEGQ